MARLGKLYKKDDTSSKFQALEAFLTHTRPSNLSRPKYIKEFEKHLNKVKAHGGDISVNVSANRLLKNVNFKQNKELRLQMQFHYQENP